MGDSIGITPFSIGGTNPSGYSLVSVFYHTCNAAAGTTYSVSSSTYDFGMLLCGNSYNHSAKPFCFASVASTCAIYSASDISSAIGTLTVMSSGIKLTGNDNGNYSFSASFALFKFNQ